MDRKHTQITFVFWIKTRVLDKNNVITIFHVIGITLTKKKKYLHENGALKSISFTFTPVSYASLK